MNFNTTVILYISIRNIIYALSIKRVGFSPTKSIFTPLGCYHPCWECMRSSQSCSVVSDSLWPHGIHSPWNSPGQNTGVGCLSLLQWIFPTQELNRVSCIAGGFFTNWAIREAFENAWCTFKIHVCVWVDVFYFPSPTQNSEFFQQLKSNIYKFK